MKNVVQLIKITLKERFRVNGSGLGGGDKQKQGKKPAYIIFWIIMAVVLLPLLIGIAVLAFLIGQLFASLGAEVIADTVSTVITFAQLVVLMVGMATLVTTLYHSNDNEILLALPIKPREIFIAKLAVVYIMELGTAFLAGLFILLPLGMGASMGAGYFIGLIPTTLLLPLLPMLLATLVAIPVTYIASAMKGNGSLSVIIMCLAFGGLFVGYYLLLYKFMPQLEVNSLENLALMLKDFVSGFGSVIYPNKLLGTFMTSVDIGKALLSLLAAVAIYAVALALTLLIASATYHKTLSRGFEHGRASGNGDGEIKIGTVENQLFVKDWKTITRYGSLGFNCFMQVIMGIILPIIMSVGLNQPVSQQEGEAVLLMQGNGFTAFVFMAFTCMLTSSNIAAAGAFSREGGDFALTKALPIDAAIIVKAKVKVGLIFNLITLSISCLLMAILGMITLPYCLLVFVCTMVYGAFQTYVGVYADLSRPRLHWRTVSEGLKNGPGTIAMLISYGVTFVVFIILALIGMATVTNTVLNLLATFGVFMILSVVATAVVRNMLMKKAALLLERVEI